jgi:hypothetical protein
MTLQEKNITKQEIAPEIEKAIQQKAKNGKIPCAVVFDIVKDLKIEIGEIGPALDTMAVKLEKCQLGLFGYSPKKRIVEPAESVSKELEDAIRKAIKNERLSCKSAWRIADSLKLRKMQVSSACEALGIKLTSCQLGAF